MTLQIMHFNIIENIQRMTKMNEMNKKWNKIKEKFIKWIKEWLKEKKCGKKVSQASNENCFQHCLSVFSTNKHMASLSVVLTE